LTPLERALKLLALRSRTEHELLRALARGGVTEKDAHDAVARLRELGYMDDRKVAAARARSLAERGDGPRKIARRLAAQGVSVQDARAAAEEARAGASEVELAAIALQRRLRGRPPVDESEKRRLLRQLVAKGHRPGAAARALGIEWDGDDEVQEE
jgi:regulatory protein